MDPLYATREDVRELSRDILTHIDRRFTEIERSRDLRHAENIDRMETIADQTRLTNGRVTTLEEVTRTLRSDFEGIRKRWHEFSAAIQRAVEEVKKLANADISSDEKPITRKELGIVIVIAIGAATMAISVTLWILSHVTKP